MSRAVLQMWHGTRMWRGSLWLVQFGAVMLCGREVATMLLTNLARWTGAQKEMLIQS